MDLDAEQVRSGLGLPEEPREPSADGAGSDEEESSSSSSEAGPPPSLSARCPPALDWRRCGV